jgi:hypothetical protein
MSKKYLHVEVQRTAETTIVIEYDDRDWSWPLDAQAMTDFAVRRACSHDKRKAVLFSEDDYVAGDTQVLGNDGGYDTETMHEPEDRLWRRFRASMSDHGHFMESLIFVDDGRVYLQLLVNGRRMRSLDSLNLMDAHEMVRSRDPSAELVARVCESFLAVTGMVMSDEDIKALMARAFS